jgi:hypothetical protein
MISSGAHLSLMLRASQSNERRERPFKRKGEM